MLCSGCGIGCHGYRSLEHADRPTTCSNCGERLNVRYQNSILQLHDETSRENEIPAKNNSQITHRWKNMKFLIKTKLIIVSWDHPF